MFRVDFVKQSGLRSRVRESRKRTENNQRERTVTLPQFAIGELVKHRTDQAQARKKAGDGWEEQGLVFPTIYGRYFDGARLYTIFKKILENAGLPGMGFHGTRHSATTILLSMGVPAKVVQEILGHSHISITLGIYGHVLPGTQQEAMDKMDDWFGNDDEKA